VERISFGLRIVRIDAVSDPFTLEDADLVSSAMDALLFMESMGLLSADVDRLDRSTLLDIAETAARAGIAQTDAARLMSEKDLDPATVRAFLERLGDSLRESPMPELELVSLLDLFPHDELGTLLGASESSLRRYASGARRPPDDAASSLLDRRRVSRGAYNDIGVRRWFQRQRTLLDGRTPAQPCAARTPDPRARRVRHGRRCRLPGGRLPPRRHQVAIPESSEQPDAGTATATVRCSIRDA
jgi:hypothetical protein